MPFKIIASQCTSSSACEPLCPNVAMSEKAGIFVIEPKKCTECISILTSRSVSLSVQLKTPTFDTSVPRYQAPA